MTKRSRARSAECIDFARDQRRNSNEFASTLPGYAVIRDDGNVLATIRDFVRDSNTAKNPSPPTLSPKRGEGSKRIYYDRTPTKQFLPILPTVVEAFGEFVSGVGGSWRG
jgi:hypothetical protein